jgi:DNA recombination protein RmuC
VKRGINPDLVDQATAQDDEYRSEEDEKALEDNEFTADPADETMSGEPATPR